MREAGAAGRHIDVVVVGKTVFKCLSGGHVGERSGGVSARKGWWQDGIGRVVEGTETEPVVIAVDGGGLGGQSKVRPRRAIFVHNALGEQVVDALSPFRFVGGEDVIEGAVLADDDD